MLLLNKRCYCCSNLYVYVPKQCAYCLFKFCHNCIHEVACFGCDLHRHTQQISTLTYTPTGKCCPTRALYHINDYVVVPNQIAVPDKRETLCLLWQSVVSETDETPWFYEVFALLVPKHLVVSNARLVCKSWNAILRSLHFKQRVQHLKYEHKYFCNLQVEITMNIHFDRIVDALKTTIELVAHKRHVLEFVHSGKRQTTKIRAHRAGRDINRWILKSGFEKIMKWTFVADLNVATLTKI